MWWIDTYKEWGMKTIPDEALSSPESFYPPWVEGVDLQQ